MLSGAGWLGRCGRDWGGCGIVRWVQLESDWVTKSRLDRCAAVRVRSELPLTDGIDCRVCQEFVRLPDDGRPSDISTLINFHFDNDSSFNACSPRLARIREGHCVDESSWLIQSKRALSWSGFFHEGCCSLFKGQELGPSNRIRRRVACAASQDGGQYDQEQKRSHRGFALCMVWVGN